MVQQARLVSQFLEMVHVNTPPKQEKPLVDRIQAHLELLGLACIRDEAHLKTGGDSGNLIATLPASRCDAPAIFFSAHFDTVEPNPNLVVHQEDGIIRTDGTSILGADDKGGMAPILEAIRVLVEQDLPHPKIELLLTVSEEIGLLGAHYLDQELVTARQGYVLDTGPPVGTIVNAAPTQDSFEIKITGRPAHAGFEPEKGVSAIRVAARAIDRMPQGRIDFETTANVGIIAGGAATNVVCPQLTMRAEARSRDPRKLAVQVEAMKAALEEAAQHFGAQVDIKVRRMYDTYRLEPTHPLLELATRAAEKCGLPTGLRDAGGGSDANVFNSFGWPTCVLATGMRNIHTHQECIAVEDLVNSAKWVLAIVAEHVAAHSDARSVKSERDLEYTQAGSA